MTIRRLGLLLFAGLLLSVTALAQEQPRRDPQAVALLQQAAAAMGSSSLGAQRQARIGLTVAGVYTRTNPAGAVSQPFRFKALGLDHFRWEFDSAEGTTVTLMRYGVGWSQTRQGMRQLSVGAAVGQQLEMFPLLAIPEWLTSPGTSLRYEGLETIDGASLHRIAIWRVRAGGAIDARAAIEQIQKYDIFLDARTLLPARLRYHAHPGDWRVNVPIELVFSDYRPFGGLRIPSTVTRSLRGQRLDQFAFDALQLGVALNPAEFGER